jgi:transposase
MFVRVKSTPNSPRKSVQLVASVRKGDKVTQKIVRYMGVAHDDDALEKLKQLAESVKIKLEAEGQPLLFTPESLAKIKQKSPVEEKESDYQVNLKDLAEEQRVVSGIHDIYGPLFEQMGFDHVIKNPARHQAAVKMFRDIVLARIANPVSKRSSVTMLEEDFGISLNLDLVYKMMDQLDEKAIEKLNTLAYQHTLELFQQKIDVIFFDCTTLYFETFEEDEFRKNGYSKDLKFNQPQVLLALMVTREGLPIGYQAFEGDTYEGHTLIPALKQLREKYQLGKVVFVADAGMMNEANLLMLEQAEQPFEYIVGSRLKNLPKQLQEAIFDPKNYQAVTRDEEAYRIGEFDVAGRRLIVSYSEKRARKDAHDRTKAIEKLKKKLAKKKNPKEYLSNYGNRKYLAIEGEATIGLKTEKIEQAARWDGLHGVITNAKERSVQETLKQYRHLWEVEQAFRISKHDLKVRPVFHWKPSRVKAHLAISFAAYTLVKQLEYRVKLQYRKMSPEQIRQNLIRVQTSILYDSRKKTRYGLPSRISQDARKIYQLCRVQHRLTPYLIKNNAPKNVVPTEN